LARSSDCLVEPLAPSSASTSEGPILFLPPYSPELQPSEPLLPLTYTALVNRLFDSIEELEETLAQRCASLQAQPHVVHSTTLFHWWPQRLKNRRVPIQR
jgi:hypothetical protein